MEFFFLVVIYNILVFPILYIAFHLAALISRKFRRGILGRYGTIPKARHFMNQLDKPVPDFFLFHCASLGEFEHIKPFLRRLKEKVPESKSVVMFFSPSGYENAKETPGVDLFLYAPFDWWLPTWRLFHLFRPKVLIIAKYDVWLNQIWAAKMMGIPRILINATLHHHSRRLLPGVRNLVRLVYKHLDRVLTISEDDCLLYQRLVSPGKIVTVGDSKYDQVIYRSQESRPHQLLPADLTKEKFIIVAGSTWGEDETQLIPAIRSLLYHFENLLVIVCPHEPTPAHLEELHAQVRFFPTCFYSQMDSCSNARVILIDQVGLLADLYGLANIAYVGGSFKQGIHNVLEPAVYGIPVIFGPVNANSHEAQLLKQAEGGFEVTNPEDLHTLLKRMLIDAPFRHQAGENARRVVIENKGATERMLSFVFQTISYSTPTPVSHLTVP